MIESFPGEKEFVERLRATLSPTLPIRSIQFLRGREKELEIIRRALVMPGRHAFIFGDRGVGKSSLAHTAANVYQSSDGAPIAVSGSADATFSTIISNVAYQALNRSHVDRISTKSSAGFSWRGLSFNSVEEVSPVDLAAHVKTIGDAAGLLAEIGKLHSREPVIVLDEFDTIADVAERNKFAALLKTIGDQEVPIKFIFTGVGSSLDDLLGAHQSAYRQLATVELARLGWDGRKEIAMETAHAFGLDLDINMAYRIAIVSDGYPYYCHLIMEKMLWDAFTADDIVEVLGPKHYIAGLHAATGDITAELRRPYQKAVLYRDRDYESVVWATADGDDLQADIAMMYSSYEMICQKRMEPVTLSRPKFGERLRQLKQPNFGSILKSMDGRAGWYTFNEKMLRGYVRMQAEANGVELNGERAAPKQQIHVPMNARNGYRGRPSIPAGVRLKGEGNDEEPRR